MAKAMMSTGSETRAVWRAEQFRAEDALTEARAILAASEPGMSDYHENTRDAFMVDWTVPGVAGIFYCQSQALAESLAAFVGVGEAQ